MKPLKYAAIALSLALSMAARGDDLETARAALRDGMWQVALEKATAAENAAMDGTLRTAARLAAVEALVKSDRAKEALSRIERAAAVDEEPENDAMRYTHAWVLSLLGRNAEALALVSPSPEDVIWRGRADILAARLLAEAGKREEARKRLAAHLKTPGETGDEARFLAAGLDAAENPGSFPKLYDEIYNEGKNASDRVFTEAALAVSRERWSRGLTNAALVAARAAADRAPDAKLKLAARSTLASMEVHQPSKRQAAAAEIRSLAETHPDEPETLAAQLALADALLAAGAAEEAAAEYSRALDLAGAGEAGIRAIEGRGRALEALGRHSEAATQFALAARFARTPAERAKIAFAQADCLLAAELFSEAARQYLAAAEDDEKAFGARGRFAAADTFAKAGEVSRARELYESVAKGRAGADEAGLWAAESHLALASLDEKENRAEDAAAHADAVLAATNLPTRIRARAHAGRGRAFYTAYRFAEAAQDFTAAARLEPERSEKTQFLVALCRFGEGRDEEARAEAEHLAAKTQNAELKRTVTRYLARLDYNAGDWAGAAKRFAECAKTSKNPEDSLWAARSAFAANEFPKAIEYAANVVADQKTPKNILSAALMVQGEALIELARYDEAVLVLDRAISQTEIPDDQRHLAVLRADALYAMGADNSERWDQALEAYRKALAMGDVPDGAKLEISFKIARCLEKLRHEDDAAREYYLNVVLAFTEARENGVWFDAHSRGVFAKAAFALADYHESRGDDYQAYQILKILARNSTEATPEARRRIANLRRKGRIL